MWRIGCGGWLASVDTYGLFVLRYSNDVAMQAVAIGFIIGVVQDSVETALNSSGDVFFTTIAE